MTKPVQRKSILRLRSIQTKLTLSIILILIPVIALLSLASFRNTQTLVNKQVFDQIDTVATAKQDEIENLFSQYLKQARILAKHSDLKSIAENKTQRESEEIAQIPSELLEIYPDFEQLILVNNQATVSASTNEKFDGKSTTRLLFDTTENAKETIQEADKKLFITVPIALDNQESWILAVQVNEKRLQTIVTDYSALGTTGEIVLGKKSGDKIIYLNDLRNRRGENDAHLSIRENPREPIVLATQRLSGSIQATDYRGVSVIAAYRYLPTSSWGLVVKIDTDEAFAPVDTLSIELLQLSSLILLLFVLVAFIVSRSIIKPLHKLHLGTEKIGQGEWDYDLDIHTGDEVEQLAGEFTNMAQELKNLYQGLEDKVKERTEELNLAKQKIEKEKIKDETILTSIGDGVIVTDAEGKIVFFNRAAEQFTGFQRNEVLGKGYFEIVGMKLAQNIPLTKDKSPVNKPLHEKKTVNTDKLMFTQKDGREYNVYLVTTPLILEEETIGAIIAFRDITHEKEVDRMKTEFISVASHQLRTPLSSIKWFTEMLLAGDAGKLKKEQKEFLDQVYKSNDRMIELVNSLLNVARIEQGRIAVEPAPTNLGELVDEVMTELTPKVKQKKLKVVISKHEKLPKVVIDAKLIRQVYANLLSNAVKYTPDGGEIQVFISRKGEEVISQIKDSGLGIPKNEHQRVFTKFFRADNIRKISSEGTGLGLYIVKSIVESSGGRIWFESEEGKGTTFWFTLPMSGSKPQKGERSLEEIKL